jgi:hypothetical protein
MLAARRHPHWDWELMAAGYLWALPATALIGFGALRSGHAALRATDPHLRALHSFLLSVAWALLLSVLFMTLRQPDYGLAKAFYGLAGLAPLCVFFGMGAGAVDRWLAQRSPGIGQPVFYAWLGGFVVTTFVPYWG